MSKQFEGMAWGKEWEDKQARLIGYMLRSGRVEQACKRLVRVIKQLYDKAEREGKHEVLASELWLLRYYDNLVENPTSPLEKLCHECVEKTWEIFMPSVDPEQRVVGNFMTVGELKSLEKLYDKYERGGEGRNFTKFLKTVGCATQ